MTVPTTNVKFSNLQTEFGGANPIALSEYVRSGTYVPATTAGAYGTIPTTSSNISTGVFRGITKLTPGSQSFTSSGTFTVPSGYTTLTIEVWGAGGAGGDGTVGGNGANSTVSGTGLTTMNAGGGLGGAAFIQGTTVAGGAGGTSSGGTTLNTTGNVGGTGNGGSGIGGDGGNGISSGTPSNVTGGTGGLGGVGSYPPGGTVAGSPGTAPGAGGGGIGREVLVMCFIYDSAGGGGGGGGYCKTVITGSVSSLAAGTVLSVTVGTGGVSSGNGGAGANGRVVITYS